MKNSLSILMAICLIFSITVPCFATIKTVKLNSNTKETPQAACARACGRNNEVTRTQIIESSNGSVSVRCYCADDFQYGVGKTYDDPSAYSQYYQYDTDLNRLNNNRTLGKPTVVTRQQQ